MSLSEKLEYARKNWSSFPTEIIYKTSEGDSLNPKLDEAFFVYSFSQIENPIFKKINIQSVYFRIFLAYKQSYSEEVGAVIFPIFIDESKLRYTPIALAMVPQKASIENVLNSTITQVFSLKSLQVLSYSCGSEIITNLSKKMKVYLEKTKAIERKKS